MVEAAGTVYARWIGPGNSSPRQAGRRCSTASWQFAEIDSATAVQVDTAGAGAAADTGRLPARSLGVRLTELCHSFGGVGRFHVAAGGGLDLHDGVDADTVSDC